MTSVINDPFLKARLDELYSAISEKIDGAKANPLRYAEVNVGVQARRIIENIRSVYVDFLDIRESQLRNPLKHQLTSIRSIISLFDHDKPDHLMAKKIQRIADDFPGNSPRPILASVHPRFVSTSSSKTNTICITLFGSFQITSKTVPTLKFSRNNTVFKSQWASNKLEFEVPTDFFDNREKNIIFLEGTLTAGMTFQVVIGALPSSAGRVHATCFVNVYGAQRQGQFGSMILDPCVDEYHHRSPFCGLDFVEEREEGPDRMMIFRDRRSSFERRHEFDFRMVSKTASSVSCELQWDVPVAFELPTNLDNSHPFLIHVSSFDGQSYVTRAPNQTSYIRVQREGSQVVVMGTLPNELNLKEK